MIQTLLRSPEDSRLRLGWRLLLGLVIIGACVLAATIPIALLDPLLAQSDLLGGAVGVTVAVGVTLGVRLAVRRVDKHQLDAVGVVRDGQWWGDLALGLALGAGLMVLIFVVEWAAGWVDVVDTFYTTGDSFVLTLMSITALFLAVGWYEELLTRGYLLFNFKGAWGTSPTALAAAVLVSSIAFGALHAGNLNLSVLSMVNLVLLGVFLAVLTLRTGSIAAAVGVHITWNWVQGPLLGLPVSGEAPEVAFLLAESRGPAWLTGAAFGPEGGLIVTAALALGTGIVWWLTRKRVPTS